MDATAVARSIARCIAKCCTQGAHASFAALARLDQAALFEALVKAGHPDISDSPFAHSIFAGMCEDGDPKNGVSSAGYNKMAELMTFFRLIFFSQTGGRPIDQAKLLQIMRKVIAQEAGERVASGLHSAMSEDEAYADEVFLRYDTNEDGLISEQEWCAMCFVLNQVKDVFMEVAGSGQTELDRAGYSAALKRLGFGDLSRGIQLQLADAVFQRSDLSNNGAISLSEFGSAVPRLLRPITWIHQMRGMQGWPGAAAAFSSATELAALVTTLQTGDVILMKIDDTMGRFLQYGLDTPWNHACVVVRRGPLTGIPNEKTEELLQRYPFRRASHKHCTPGYCRCFDESAGDFAPSALSGTGAVGLLESTGEGIHVYDLAHRLFESSYATCYSSLAVLRLRNAPGRDDQEKVDSFLREVRGSLYSTDKNEFKLSLQHHHEERTSARDLFGVDQAEALSTKGSDRMATESHFCSKVVSSFLQHMGWMSKDRPPSSVMPPDFLGTESERASSERSAPAAAPGSCSNGKLARPVVLQGEAYFEPVEVLWSTQLGVPLPVKFKKEKKLKAYGEA